MFQYAPRHKGATYLCMKHCLLVGIFQSTPRHKEDDIICIVSVTLSGYFNPRPATRGRPQYIVHIPLHIPHLPNPPYRSPPYRIKPLQLYHVISASALGFYARFRFAPVNPHSYYDTRYARIHNYFITAPCIHHLSHFPLSTFIPTTMPANNI